MWVKEKIGCNVQGLGVHWEQAPRLNAIPAMEGQKKKLRRFIYIYIYIYIYVYIYAVSRSACLQ
jgi:hypothetical protein